MSESNRGKIFINDGKRMRRIDPTADVPEGWSKGIIFTEETIERRNAGIRAAYASMTAEEKAALAMTRGTYGKVWITNEEVDRPHPKDQPIPEGWRKGRKFVPRKSRREALAAKRLETQPGVE